SARHHHTRDQHSFPTRRSSDLDTTALRETLQDKLSRKALPEELLPRLRTACEQLTRLYRPIIEAGLLTETFFDDVRDEVARELRDRKSTRLNSSHGSISYAVFC